MEIERVDVDANGFTFTMRAAGRDDARPVLLLHGFPQNSWSWRPTLLALGERHFRAMAVDQRGYSDGARPEEVEAYALDHLVSDVLALADTLDLKTFDLVGHDWGGMVAWVTAARHADRVRSLCVISTPHPGALRAAWAHDADQVQRSGYMELFRRADEPEQLLLGADGSGSGIRAIFTGAGLDSSVADEYVATLTRPGAMTAALNWYRAEGMGDEVLPPVVVPTLYVWSDGDAALGRTAAEATAEYVAGRYRFEVMPNVSHWVLEEAPDQFNDLLISHLADT
jgi:pimeloyl-ACP methyl ester carboxylesterase